MESCEGFIAPGFQAAGENIRARHIRRNADCSCQRPGDVDKPSGRQIDVAVGVLSVFVARDGRRAADGQGAAIVDAAAVFGGRVARDASAFQKQFALVVDAAVRAALDGSDGFRYATVADNQLRAALHLDYISAVASCGSFRGAVKRVAGQVQNHGLAARNGQGTSLLASGNIRIQRDVVSLLQSVVNVLPCPGVYRVLHELRLAVGGQFHRIVGAFRDKFV